MSEHDLNTLLEQLRIEMDAVEHGAKEDRERLEGLVASLERRLANPREDNEDEELLGTLTQLLTHYEADHPRITGVLNRILVTLSSLGI